MEDVELQEKKNAELAPEGVRVDVTTEEIYKSKFETQEEKDLDSYCLVFAIGKDEKPVKVPENSQFLDEDVQAEDRKLTEKQLFILYSSEVVRKLREARLDVSLFKIASKTKVFCIVSGSEERLKEEAERTKCFMELDAEQLEVNGSKRKLTLVQRIREEPEEEGMHRRDRFTRKMLEHTFAHYTRPDQFVPHRDELFKKYTFYEGVDGEKARTSIFSSSQRQKLIRSIIFADSRDGGAGLQLPKFKVALGHPLLDFYPLHHHASKKALYREWVGCKRPCNEMVLYKVRDYFGEQVSLYFAFLQFYMKALLAPSALGALLFILQYLGVSGWKPFNNPLVPPYSVFVALWASMFVEFWKRKNFKLNVYWGMSNFVEVELPRPQFHGIRKPDRVDGLEREVEQFWTRLGRIMISQMVVWTFIAIVFAIVVALLTFRTTIEMRFLDIMPDNPDKAKYASYATSFLTALQIQILNYIYWYIARRLNNFENHRTESQYENYLIGKIFLFKFINCYNSLFYLAFFKKFHEDVGYCCNNSLNEFEEDVKKCIANPYAPSSNNDCMEALQIQIGIIFATQIIALNLVELFWVFLYYFRTLCNRTAQFLDFDEEGTDSENPNSPFTEGEDSQDSESLTASGVLNPRAARQQTLKQYQSTFLDFDELVIQFGYGTLFVVACPIAPLLALIAAFIENYLDSSKLFSCRRPEPLGRHSIGTWLNIIKILGIMAVFTNCVLVVFYANDYNLWFVGTNLQDADILTKMTVFILFEHICVGIKIVVDFLVPDESTEALEKLRRQEFLESHLVNGKPTVAEREEGLKQEINQRQSAGDFSVVRDMPDVDAAIKAAQKHYDLSQICLKVDMKKKTT